MQRRVIRRAMTAAMMLTVLATGAAFAESVSVDADAVTVGDQSTVDLGTARPGEDVHIDATFRLECSGTSHVDATQIVRLTLGARTIPPGGSFSNGTVNIDPPAGWPADGEPCPAGLAAATGTRHIIVAAPLTTGTDLVYSFTWNQALFPATATDTGVLEGSNPTVTFILDVAVNTPPSLDLPADATVEGDTTGGAVAAYVVSATDAEDATDPVPACSPAVGDVLPLGTTTVSCTATDSAGLEATGSFDITVVDTTAPRLAGMPADRSVTTADPDGTTVTFESPTATDVVDADPAVVCSPASGSVLPVGVTTVTCTATDDDGNSSSESFDVSIAHVDPVAWSATWGEPVATDGGAFSANRGRTIPVKVELFADGVEQTSGDAWLDVAQCDGTPALRTPLDWDGDRWAVHLDTSGLGGPGCYTATASLDGHVAGSFQLDLRGSATALKKR